MNKIFNGSLNKNDVTGPMYVVLNITNMCNLRCLHCFNNSPKYNTEKQVVDLSDKKILSLIDELIELKVANVCFSGGEPFMREKLLFKCLYKLSSANIRTSIVTNGTFIDKYKADYLKILGVKEIQISLDGSCPEIHEKMRNIEGCFDKAINAIKLLQGSGIITSVSLTVNKWNITDIENIYSLLKNLNITALNIRPLLMIGEALENQSINVSDCDYRLLAKKVKFLNEKKNGLHIEINDPINHIYYYKNANVNTVIEIQNNGYVYLSYCIPIALCDLKTISLKEAWSNTLKNGWKLTAIRSIVKNIYCISDL